MSSSAASTHLRGLVAAPTGSRSSRSRCRSRSGCSRAHRRRCRPRGRPGRSRRTRAPRRPSPPRSASGSGPSAATPAWCATPLELASSPVAGQPPVDGGRRHPHQQGGGVVVDVQLAEPPQHGTSSASIGASRLPGGMPSTAQQKISAATTFGPYFGGRGRRALHDPRSQRRFERLACVVAMPAGRGAQLVEDPALPGLVRTARNGSRSPSSQPCARLIVSPIVRAYPAIIRRRTGAPYARILR